MRTVLRGALATGIAIGLGAAVIDATYAALGQAGAAALLEIGVLRLALGAIGAVVPVGLGVRALWMAFRVRAGGATEGEVAAGVALGTTTWFTALSVALTLVRRRVGTRALRAVDVIAGSGLVAFGGALGWRTLGDDGR
ncbi:MAG: hypothetical protein QOJ12_2579 [Thermoleophilales bacterium]|nr:hypothetical protein [Thermoleophilales bacterium]